MNVEERVRRALHEDASKLEVPPRPSLANLERSNRRSRWAWAAAAAVVVAASVAVAVVATGLVPENTVTIGPGDEPTSLGTPPDALRFDDDEVFAEGTRDGVRWIAAATGGEHPCVGVQVDLGDKRLASSECGPLHTAPIRATHQTDPEAGVLAIAGWVSEEVARVVWELPDETRDLPLEQREGLPGRVFGAAASPGEDVSVLWAYDDTGHQLGGTGVPGAHEPNGDQQDAVD